MKNILSGLQRNVGIVQALMREKGPIYVLSCAVAGYLLAGRRAAVKCEHLVSARLLGRPLVHVVGDSHSWTLLECPGTVIHNIGPATAYNLANRHSKGQYGTKLNEIVGGIDREKDYVLLVFGEIDCRVHIYHHHLKSGRTMAISSLIDRTVRNYGKMMEQMRSSGVRFGICGVVPATGHIIRYPTYATPSMRQQLREEFSRSYPHQATPEIASVINREFNAKLKAYCQEHGYPYCDIYSKIVDERGFMKEEYRKDEIHANDLAGVLVGLWLDSELVQPGLTAMPRTDKWGISYKN